MFITGMQAVNNGEKLPEIYKTIKGIQIPLLILGDSAISHHTWLQKSLSQVWAKSRVFENQYIGMLYVVLKKGIESLKI